MKIIKTIIIYILCSIFLLTALYADDFLKIHFIDAGEGDSIFIQTTDNKNILIDTGNTVTGIKIYTYLKSLKIEKIHHLIITHPHADHIGGVFSLFQLFDVEHIYDNGENISQIIKENDFYRWYNELVRNDSRFKKLKRGDSLIFDNASFTVLWPKEKTFTDDWNANSLVLLLKYGGFKCLFMGDAVISTEKNLLEFKESIKAQILKAGHHGAEDTADPNFLEHVKPETVIISINKNNIRNYPSKEVIKRYKKNGAKVYTTYEFGTIIIKAKKDGTYEII
ncbi:ComEC/Rec2 family competence protein [bacterium]